MSKVPEELSFTDKDTEALTCIRSHSKKAVDLGFEPPQSMLLTSMFRCLRKEMSHACLLGDRYQAPASAGHDVKRLAHQKNALSHSFHYLTSYCQLFKRLLTH